MNKKIGLKVLAIDDEHIMLQNLVDFLSDSGYEVIPSDNGKEGLELFFSSQPDVILLDLNMPEVSGFDVLATITDKSPDTPIIVISGVATIEAALEATRLGAWDFLIKPINEMSIVGHHIQKVCERAKLLRENKLYKHGIEKEVEKRTGQFIQAHENLQQINVELEHLIKTQTTDLSQKSKELEVLQSRLMHNEKLAALGQLLATISHEINTPLGAIRSSISTMSEILNHYLPQFPTFFDKIPTDLRYDFFLLLEKATHKDQVLSAKEQRQIRQELTKRLKPKFPGKANKIARRLVEMGLHEGEEYIESLLEAEDCESLLEMASRLTILKRSSKTIENAAEQVSGVIQSLKSFANKDNIGRAKSILITNELEKILTLYQGYFKYGIEVVRVFEDVPRIYCNVEEINQVWTNLIQNAVHAMGTKGKLTISVTAIDDNKVKVAITDTGTGIPDNIKDSIFDPFFTTKGKQDGSGLGLDIVKRIITNHSGDISFESEPGATTFTVVLPVKPESLGENLFII